MRTRDAAELLRKTARALHVGEVQARDELEMMALRIENEMPIDDMRTLAEIVEGEAFRAPEICPASYVLRKVLIAVTLRAVADRMGT